MILEKWRGKYCNLCFNFMLGHYTLPLLRRKFEVTDSYLSVLVIWEIRHIFFIPNLVAWVSRAVLERTDPLFYAILLYTVPHP